MPVQRFRAGQTNYPADIASAVHVLLLPSPLPVFDRTAQPEAMKGCQVRSARPRSSPADGSPSRCNAGSCELIRGLLSSSSCALPAHTFNNLAKLREIAIGAVVIGMDPHKRSATIEVMDRDETILGGGRYATDVAGYAELIA